MCDRYVLPDQVAAEREFLPALAWWNFAAKYNVAPQQYVPAIRVQGTQTEAMMMRWGFIPAWAEGRPTEDHPMTCIDMEELGHSSAYRLPWLGSQRCILPVAGFYAWQMTRENYRQPYFIRLIERSVFGVAAVWDRSESEEDDVIESCSIIRVSANDLLAGILNPDGRMPAILRRRDYATWLRGTPVEAKAALQPYKSDWMLAYPVSPRINSPAPDDAGLIEPVS